MRQQERESTMLMEKIYWGEFDPELLRISVPEADERKVGSILRAI